MSMAYVRKTYGVPAARGRRVEVRKSNGAVFRGTITRCTHYVFIRLDGERHARPYHPTDPCLTYLGTPDHPTNYTPPTSGKEGRTRVREESTIA